MIDEPTLPDRPWPVGLLRPLAMVAALVLSGCTGPPKAKLAAPPAAGGGRVVETAWLVRGQSADPPPPPGPAAESPPPPVATEPLPPAEAGPPALEGLPVFSDKLTPGDPSRPAGCATCGGIGQMPVGDGTGFRACSSCGGSGCVPGRKPCSPYEGHTIFGRFCSELYAALCCPDPCYEPGWVAAANAAFFVDSPRPRTIMRLRNDYAWDFQFPDRNEYFWAREQIQRNTPPNASGGFASIPGGSGPGRPNRFPKRKPFLGQPSIDYDQFSFYNEAAVNPRASVFVELNYRTVSPRFGGYHAGFADMNTGTKGVIFDSEILLLTTEFRTYIPTGVASQGLGTGHVSLEPSLLAALKLGPDAYLQGQLSEWIPIGGDRNYQGAILHYHGSYNQVICRLAPDSPLIATFEGQGYSFQDGAYTNPAIGPYVKSSGTTYFSLGAGLRAVICNAIDFGGAIAFPVSNPHWGDPTIRIELRILY